MTIINHFYIIQTNLKLVELLITQTYGLELLNVAALPEPEFYITNDKISVVWRKDWKHEVYLIATSKSFEIVYRYNYRDYSYPATVENLFNYLNELLN